MKYATILFAPLVAALIVLIVLIAVTGGVYAAPRPLSIAAIVADDASDSSDVQSASGIAEFRAIPARLRGRIDLSWKYTGRTVADAFVVERSTNGSSWRSVMACGLPYNAQRTAYACTDARLTSGTTYAYRACLVTSGASCSSGSATKPVSVKAP